MIISTLRTNKLLDEQAYKNQLINNIHITDEDSDYDTDYDSADEENSSNNSDFYDSDEDSDSHVDYPFNADEMRYAQPCRVLIVINNQPVEAILDSGAAVSVLSAKLANRLGITPDTSDSIPLSGFASHSRAVNCKVATDVEVRIGGKLRREHFCIDESEKEKNTCLLGRPWIRQPKVDVVM
ncbi:uncharacterized protein B0P05DRAFT_322096 [Gilbertella persicaria]|uniref:uncharacterized protein n=1 Tax=Gilbertella persicaria TaxID=101096 RepID=UPI00221F8E72|nr:uncharacterized protein B0P05DRAFT_322096 [Gilbertella persicaria]KAI8049822.1 hypothetical protein B0P05DRAFT_322096 [Gilbertella persicaria]